MAAILTRKRWVEISHNSASRCRICHLVLINMFIAGKDLMEACLYATVLECRRPVGS